MATPGHRLVLIMTWAACERFSALFFEKWIISALLSFKTKGTMVFSSLGVRLQTRKKEKGEESCDHEKFYIIFTNLRPLLQIAHVKHG